MVRASFSRCRRYANKIFANAPYSEAPWNRFCHVRHIRNDLHTQETIRTAVYGKRARISMPSLSSRSAFTFDQLSLDHLQILQSNFHLLQIVSHLRQYSTTSGMLFMFWTVLVDCPFEFWLMRSTVHSPIGQHPGPLCIHKGVTSTDSLVFWYPLSVLLALAVGETNKYASVITL